MKYCVHCGAQLNDDAAFCQTCGKKVEVSTEIVTSEQAHSYNSMYIKERNIVAAIIFSIITCGIYGIYWMIKVNDEMLELSGEKGQSGGVVFLLSLVTCGIYGFFWWYKMGICANKIEGKENGSNHILYLVLSITGVVLTFLAGIGGICTIVNYCLAQNVINEKVSNQG